MINHKGDYRKKVEVYMGFGHYEYIPTTVCRGRKGFYSDNPPKGVVVRNWKEVNCKECLKKKPIPAMGDGL